MSEKSIKLVVQQSTLREVYNDVESYFDIFESFKDVSLNSLQIKNIKKIQKLIQQNIFSQDDDEIQKCEYKIEKYQNKNNKILNQLFHKNIMYKLKIKLIKSTIQANHYKKQTLLTQNIGMKIKNLRKQFNQKIDEVVQICITTINNKKQKHDPLFEKLFQKLIVKIEEHTQYKKSQIRISNKLNDLKNLIFKLEEYTKEKVIDCNEVVKKFKENSQLTKNDAYVLQTHSRLTKLLEILKSEYDQSLNNFKEISQLLNDLQINNSKNDVNNIQENNKKELINLKQKSDDLYLELKDISEKQLETSEIYEKKFINQTKQIDEKKSSLKTAFKDANTDSIMSAKEYKNQMKQFIKYRNLDDSAILKQYDHLLPSSYIRSVMGSIFYVFMIQNNLRDLQLLTSLRNRSNWDKFEIEQLFQQELFKFDVKKNHDFFQYFYAILFVDQIALEEKIDYLKCSIKTRDMQDSIVGLKDLTLVKIMKLEPHQEKEQMISLLNIVGDLENFSRIKNLWEVKEFISECKYQTEITKSQLDKIIVINFLFNQTNLGKPLIESFVNVDIRNIILSLHGGTKDLVEKGFKSLIQLKNKHLSIEKRDYNIVTTGAIENQADKVTQDHADEHYIVDYSRYNDNFSDDSSIQPSKAEPYSESLEDYKYYNNNSVSIDRSSENANKNSSTLEQLQKSQERLTLIEEYEVESSKLLIKEESNYLEDNAIKLKAKESSQAEDFEGVNNLEVEGLSGQVSQQSKFNDVVQGDQEEDDELSDQGRSKEGNSQYSLEENQDYNYNQEEINNETINHEENDDKIKDQSKGESIKENVNSTLSKEISKNKLEKNENEVMSESDGFQFDERHGVKNSPHTSIEIKKRNSEVKVSSDSGFNFGEKSVHEQSHEKIELDLSEEKINKKNTEGSSFGFANSNDQSNIKSNKTFKKIDSVESGFGFTDGNDKVPSNVKSNKSFKKTDSVESGFEFAHENDIDPIKISDKSLKKQNLSSSDNFAIEVKDKVNESKNQDISKKEIESSNQNKNNSLKLSNLENEIIESNKFQNSNEKKNSSIKSNQSKFSNNISNSRYSNKNYDKPESISPQLNTSGNSIKQIENSSNKPNLNKTSEQKSSGEKPNVSKSQDKDLSPLSNINEHNPNFNEINNITPVVDRGDNPQLDISVDKSEIYSEEDFSGDDAAENLLQANENKNETPQITSETPHFNNNNPQNKISDIKQPLNQDDEFEQVHSSVEDANEPQLPTNNITNTTQVQKSNNSSKFEFSIEPNIIPKKSQEKVHKNVNVEYSAESSGFNFDQGVSNTPDKQKSQVQRKQSSDDFNFGNQSVDKNVKIESKIKKDNEIIKNDSDIESDQEFEF